MSYAPASPDLSSLYSGSASTQTTSTTATQIGRTAPLAPSAPSGFSLPASPTSTIIHQPFATYYQEQPQQQQQHQYQEAPPPSQHQQHQQHPHHNQQAGGQPPSHHSLSHFNTPRHTAYPLKSPVSPRGNRHLYSSHPYAPHPRQIHARFDLHSPQSQSPQPPRVPLQPAAPLDLNAHVASPAQTQFQQAYAVTQPQQQQQQNYKLASPQASSPYVALQQNFTQPGGPVSTGHSYRLEPPLHIESEHEYSHSAGQGQIRMPPRRSTAAAVQPPPIDPSPVKTKFPTARIKRIMQADEEVGKVAQQTPIAVGKALELFMVALVSKSHDIAKDKGAKRVTAQHLKQVVESDDQWDFLREIVGRVSETEDKSKAGRAKAESSSDEEQPVEVKKKGRGGRKKKTA